MLKIFTLKPTAGMDAVVTAPVRGSKPNWVKSPPDRIGIKIWAPNCWSSMTIVPCVLI